MTIRINQVAVDFTLERETTVADLTVSLRTWATDQNLAILGILIDGKSRGPDDSTLLSQVSLIDVEAVPAGERDLARVAVVAGFFSLLAQAWSKNDQTLLAELNREYPSVRQALFPLLDPIGPRLTRALTVLDGSWQTATGGEGAARLLATETEHFRQELQDPQGALTRSLDFLEALGPKLESLARLFQKGQDRDGFDLILSLFTTLDDLGRQAGLATRRQESLLGPWKQFSIDLHPFLKEAEGALAAGDFILLTDLLEYEITPRLRGLRDLFLEILNLDPVPELL